MKYTRRELLSAISCYGIGLMLPSKGVAISSVKNNNSCSVHPDTLKIIKKHYGTSSLNKSDSIKFIRKHWMFYERGVGTGKYYAENSARMPFSIEFDPSVISGPIVFIMERYNYHGGLDGSEYVAKYQVNDNVSSISFWAKAMPLILKPTSGIINMFAIALSGKSIVYTCHQVRYSFGEDGCC